MPYNAMNPIKETVKRLVGYSNYRVVHSPRGSIRGISLRDDINVLVKTEHPLCFDVGANRGQTIDLLNKFFRQPEIYAFEPSSESFPVLTGRRYGPSVRVFKMALGATCATNEFVNYEDSTLSSLLTIESEQESQLRHVGVKCKESVEVRTIDSFMAEHRINQIDVLKIDAQGYDLEVLKGAQESLSRGAVRNVLVELNFVALYENQADPDQIAGFLARHGMPLVDYYDKVRTGHSLAWCNALFSAEKPEVV
jgi:FkbM family methyltransferase